MPKTDNRLFSEFSQITRQRSARRWGTKGEVRMIGKSPVFLCAQQRLLQFSRVDNHILLTGESGVGKELFARALYLHCDRREQDFVSVNCAQYRTGSLLVSELFGHRSGSFTGASNDRKGIFEEADGGVIFLDEVGELTLEAQSMLLRVLGEGEIKRVGDARSKHVDVRVVAATNRPLDEMVREGAFRRDLYYRLRALHVVIPPLRKRGKDIEMLATFILRCINRKNRNSKTLLPETLDLFATHDWPGNVRELQNAIQAGWCLTTSTVIEPQHVEPMLESGEAADVTPGDETCPEQACYADMTEAGNTFWTSVRERFMSRELNRDQVQSIIGRGLDQADGSYKKLLSIFNIESNDYTKFMDFLRHHSLKP